MTTRKNQFNRPLVAVLVAVGLLGFAAGAFAADPPVKVVVAVTGTPTPGATVTAKATVTINDGSTLSGITWTQTGGVAATLSNASTDTVTVALPNRLTFKEELITILEEPPVAPGNLPPYIPPPAAEFRGGLQNRFSVVGISPRSLEEAGAIALDIAVVTTSGTYHTAYTLATVLPWASSTGNRNIPVLVPVLLHGKTQATYNWTMTVPTGSTATLTDAAAQSPEFTPDVLGTYQITVTDLATNQPVTMAIYAGTWKGVITGQDADGRPVADVNCRTCHASGTPLDQFTPWAHSGHAEIFTQNVVTPNGHYSAACLSCHMVGYDPKVVNNGADDQADFAAMMASGLVTHGEADNWTKILAQFPASARLANIQCENCHGPQDSLGHAKLDEGRQSLSSDLCGTCHGEPARHGRFQQWQLSGHANYETAEAEGTNASCTKCHSAQGFLAWEKNGWSNAAIAVTWTADEVHPQTCQTCHDPHAVGTTSGGPTTNATVRLSGDTMMLDAGFKATGVGKGAICMACHNSRRGLRDDAHPLSVADASRAPHVPAQADMIMGQNLYFTAVGQRSYHSMIEDTCVTCHMESTPPPADLSYALGGTNHTFYASREICSKCHSTITADSVQAGIDAQMVSLKAAVEGAIKTTLQAQIKLGKKVKLGTAATAPVITNAADIASVGLFDASGRQAIQVTKADGSVVPASPVGLNSVKIVPPAGAEVEFYAVADINIAKAAWNLLTAEADRSEGVHNPGFIKAALDVALYAAKNAKTTGVTVVSPIGGGPGNGLGAVSCATPYVYWAEIVAHNSGNAGSQWRTDIVARNLSGSEAALRFVLHQETAADIEGTGSVAASAQKAFEDIVATLGGTEAKGSLEICSNQPLLVNGRMFNQGTAGTFGQDLDGHVANLGYAAGDTFSLIGLRQKTDEYRTNFSVTNGGTTEANVSVTLYDAAGNALNTYTQKIAAGKVWQDSQPFVARAGQPELGWGFATVTVLAGTNIQSSASVIDMKTNDPTTVPAKQ